jgi:hypothetical protein
MIVRAQAMTGFAWNYFVLLHEQEQIVASMPSVGYVDFRGGQSLGGLGDR